MKRKRVLTLVFPCLLLGVFFLHFGPFSFREENSSISGHPLDKNANKESNTDKKEFPLLPSPLPFEYTLEKQRHLRANSAKGHTLQVGSLYYSTQAVMKGWYCHREVWGENILIHFWIFDRARNNKLVLEKLNFRLSSRETRFEGPYPDWCAFQMKNQFLFKFPSTIAKVIAGHSKPQDLRFQLGVSTVNDTESIWEFPHYGSTNHSFSKSLEEARNTSQKFYEDFSRAAHREGRAKWVQDRQLQRKKGTGPMDLDNRYSPAAQVSAFDEKREGDGEEMESTVAVVPNCTLYYYNQSGAKFNTTEVNILQEEYSKFWRSPDWPFHRKVECDGDVDGEGARIEEDDLLKTKKKKRKGRALVMYMVSGNWNSVSSSTELNPDSLDRIVDDRGKFNRRRNSDRHFLTKLLEKFGSIFPKQDRESPEPQPSNRPPADATLEPEFQIPPDFDPDEYLALNYDIVGGRVLTPDERVLVATDHYLKYGRKEYRPYKQPFLYSPMDGTKYKYPRHIDPINKQGNKELENGNFDFFVQFGYIGPNVSTPLFDGIDYVIYRRSSEVEAVTLCAEADNVKVLLVPMNGRCDLCAHGRVLTYLNYEERVVKSTWPYRSIVMVNSGTRGPFLSEQEIDELSSPSAATGDLPTTWVDVASMAEGTRPRFMMDEREILYTTISGVRFNYISIRKTLHLQSYFLSIPVSSMPFYYRIFNIGGCWERRMMDRDTPVLPAENDKFYCIWSAEIKSHDFLDHRRNHIRIPDRVKKSKRFNETTHFKFYDMVTGASFHGFGENEAEFFSTNIDKFLRITAQDYFKPLFHKFGGDGTLRRGYKDFMEHLTRVKMMRKQRGAAPSIRRSTGEDKPAHNLISEKLLEILYSVKDDDDEKHHSSSALSQQHESLGKRCYLWNSTI